MFLGQKLYDNISKWLLTKEELLENGYPQPGAPKKGYALFKDNRIIEKIPENSQLCVRCKKIYAVTEDGYPVFPEDCIYHPGSRFVFRGVYYTDINVLNDPSTRWWFILCLAR